LDDLFSAHGYKYESIKESIVETLNETELEQELEKILRSMDRLGPINLAASNEYEEEAKRKEEEAKRTYEEELEEQLTEEEITGFQIDKTNMDRLANRVCEIIISYGTDGMIQTELWKKLKLSSRDGSRLALKLERLGMITREKILENGRWTYKLIIRKAPVSTISIENAPCLICPVESKCGLNNEISPKTCQYIEDWVFVELKTSKSK